MTRSSIYILAIKRKSKKGERVSLFQRLYYGGEQWQTSLDISVPVAHYNAKTERVTKEDDAEVYNRIIQVSKQTLHDILLRYELIEHRQATIKEVADEYRQTMTEQGLLRQKGVVQKPRAVFFHDHLDEFINTQSRERSWADATTRLFRAIQRHLNDYSEKVTMTELSDEFLCGLLEFWTDDIGLSNTSAMRYLKSLKWYLRWCGEKGYYQGNLYDTFTPKLKGSNYENRFIVYLTQDELQALEDFEPSEDNPRLGLVRDVFLFSCYCGLRYSDVERLKEEDIHDDAINIITKKTNDLLTINLNKHTRAILHKYRAWADITGKCLPMSSNRITNTALRELCKECGIDTPTKKVTYKGTERIETFMPKYELVTFHVARKTFITHAARLGIPAEVIMKFSGHHSFEMLKVYLEIADDLKKKEMSKFDMM